MKKQMNLAWPAVLIAVFFEVGWVIGLKHAVTMVEWGATAIAIVVSFVLLIWAGSKLSVGTVYAVFVGLGTAGTAIMDWFIFSESMNLLTVVFLILLLVGVIGLKVSSEEKQVERGVE